MQTLSQYRLMGVSQAAERPCVDADLYAKARQIAADFRASEASKPPAGKAPGSDEYRRKVPVMDRETRIRRLVAAGFGTERQVRDVFEGTGHAVERRGGSKIRYFK